MKAIGALVFPALFAAALVCPAAASAEAAGPGPQALETAAGALQRLETADSLSKSGRLDEAIGIYKEVLASGPGNAEARISLARAFAWAGRYDESVMEYRRVLTESPGNTDASIGLGRVLSWKGELREAASVLSGVLREKPGNREASMALANALRWDGELDRAYELSERLVSEDPSDKDAVKLNEGLRGERGPLLSSSITDSSDSDSNEMTLYKASTFFRLGRAHRITVEYAGFDVSRLDDEAQADMLNLRDAISVTRDFNIAPRLSLVSLNSAADDTVMLTHGLSLDWKPAKGLRTIIAYGYNPLVDTAQLVRNNIRLAEYSGAVIYDLRKFTFSAGVSYGDYSDDNTRTGFNGGVSWAADDERKIVGGYTLEYREFSEKTSSGYFNPGSIFSNSVFVTLSDDFYNGKAGYFLTGTAGTQSHSSKSEFTSSVKAGLSGRITGNLTAEAAYKWSRSALESASGFRHEEMSVGIKYLF